MEVPTYDYECTKCGDTFSVEQSILDKPLARCRKCGGKLKKLLPREINLIFKGSGFYVTDYKKSSSQAGKEKAPSAGSKSGGSKQGGAKA